MVTERVNEGVEVDSANLHGANVAVVDVSMGAGRVGACTNVRSDPPMTLPQGHEQELMSGCGELTGSSVSLEVAMSEGHVCRCGWNPLLSHDLAPRARPGGEGGWAS